MARLRIETLDRVEQYSDRVLDVVAALEAKKVYARVIDQLAGSGTSVGANVFEADEAMTNSDFAKTLGVVLKELNETRYWLRLCGRRNWIRASRLTPLLNETLELKAMFGAMALRTRRNAVKKAARR
jgi:four helix bundle protein